MKKHKNKFIYLLAAVIVWGSVLPMITTANPWWAQRRVSTTEIIDDTPRNNPMPSSQYNIRLSWMQPDNQTQINDDTIQSGPRFATSFNIHMRNATAREVAPGDIIGNRPSPEGGNSQEAGLIPYQHSGLSMVPNSLYEFTVRPVRMFTHRIPDTNSPSGFRTETRQAPTDLSGPAERTALYLTDMTLSGVASGNELTVTWTPPTFNNGRTTIDLFDAYELFYQESPGPVDPNNRQPITGNPIIVRMDDPLLVRNQDGTVSYTIVDPSLRSGYFISLKIEPRYANMRVRRPNLQTTVTVDGQQYSLTYRHPDVEYRDDRTYIRPGLNVTAVGEHYLRLFWGQLANTYSGYELSRIEIYESLFPPEGEIDEQNPQTDLPQAGRPIAIIRGNETSQTNFFLERHNNLVKYFQIIIFYTPPPNFVPKPGEPPEIFMKSDVAVFDPVFADFRPYKPTIYRLREDPSVSSPSIGLQINWLAFLRHPYTKDEEDDITSDYLNTDLYLDRDVYYDIYIADDFDSLADLTFAYPPINTVRHGADLDPIVDYPDPNTGQSFPTYQRTFNQYYAYDPAEGTYALKPIEGNKTYYVRIIATRVPPKGPLEVSDPADGTLFVPPKEGIQVPPQMISAPPLRTVETTETTMTITWPNWFIEVYRPEDSQWMDTHYPDDEKWYQPDQWYSVVGAHPETGKMVFGRSSIDIESIDGGTSAHWFTINDVLAEPVFRAYAQLNPDLFNDLAGVNALLDTVGDRVRSRMINDLKVDPNSIPANLKFRVVDLRRANYQVHTANYELVTENVDDQLSAEARYRSYMNQQNASATGWIEAPNHTITDGMNRVVITTAQNPNGPLVRNTPYLVLLRPYYKESNLRAYYPAYTIGVTQDPKPPLDIIPNTPVLFPDKATDYTLRVYWEYIDGLEYEIRYSERLIDYSGGGTLVAWSSIEPQIKMSENRVERDGKTFVYFTIEDLFPDTEYYIWIRARNPKTGEYSPSWSNPITMRTLDIQPPPPPIIAPASPYFIGEYNRQNDTKYAPIEENAFNLMWQIVGGDNPPLATGGTGDGTSLELDELAAALIHMVRFEDLLANREYYIRAKTVLTVTKGPGNPRTYTYVIEMSLNDDYSDPLVFSIPALTDISGAPVGTVRRRESEWYEIRLTTNRSPDDADGDVNPEHFPLPDRDWDLTYDEGTETLKYRFRSNQMGSDGKLDQQADQRFISRLIAQRTQVFSIDLTSYMGHPISVREVEMPYSVLKAFDDRKITLEVKSDAYTFAVPPGAFDTAAVRALPMGVGSNVNLTMSLPPQNLPMLPDGQLFSAEPQRVQVRVGTDERSVRLEAFNKPMTVALSGEGRMTPSGFNAGLVMNNANVGGWQSMGGSYNANTKDLRSNLPRAGTVGAITRTAPEAIAFDASFDAMQRVTNMVSITDLHTYDSAERVTANRFNNIVAAIANNRTVVSMEDNLSAADTQSLTRARMLVSDTVSREAAISSLVQLYELKTKRVIRPGTSPSSVPGISDSSPNLRNNLLKAVDIGLVEGDLRPRDGLSMGELMSMLDIVLQDAGI